MSSRGVTFALEQEVRPATLKLLLVAMGDHANPETSLCYPSIAALEKMTSLNRKTIPGSVAKLVELGFLVDTGKRTGRTGQITVYRFTFSRRSEERGPKSDTSERSPISDRKRPDFASKEARNRATEPRIEPKKEDSPPSPFGEGHPPSGIELVSESVPAKPPTLVEPPIEDYVLERWNALAERHPGITGVRTLDASRRKKIRARANAVATDAMSARQVWDAVIERIEQSTYLCGEDPPGKGYASPFRLTIDFVIRPSEFLKILEGGYRANRSTRTHDPESGRRFGPAEQAGRASLERLRATWDQGQQNEPCPNSYAHHSPAVTALPSHHSREPV